MARRIAPGAQEDIATARYIRMSPSKARQVVDLIRGRHVEDARRVLRFSERSASAPVAKVLDSAIANAGHNRSLPEDELFVARAWVDEGPTLRRYRPRALGRATRIRKRTCHISVVVGRSEELVTAPPAPSKTTTRRRSEQGSGDAKKTTGRAPSATKTAAKKTSGKPAAQEGATQTTTAKKSTAKKSTAKKSTAKKSTAKKSTAKTNEGEGT